MNIFRHPFALRLAGATLLLGQGACAPADNWRELQWPSAHLAAQFPCKPDQLERAGATLARCEAQGQAFSLSWQPMATPDVARKALLGVVQRFDQQTGVAAHRLTGTVPKGALEWSEAGRYAWRSAPGEVRVMIWARGLTVYQATIVSPPGAQADAAADRFFHAVRGLP